MESGSLPEIEEINFTSSDNKSPIVNCDPPRGQQKWVIVTTSLYNTLDTLHHSNPWNSKGFFYIKQQEFRVRIQGSPYSVESVLLDYYHLIVVYFIIIGCR